MATTAGEIAERVQALGYGADVSAPQLLALNMLHKRVLNTRRWRFLASTESSLTTTAGTGTYTVDTLDDTKRIDAVRLQSATGDHLNLEHAGEQLIRDFEHMYRSSGTPEYWAQLGQKLHIWPIPDKTYTIMVDVVALPNEIKLVGDTIQIPDSHADILVWGTIMGMTFRERDWDAHNFARQMYAELLSEMQAQYGISDRQTAKRVEESGFYDCFDVEDSWLI